MSYIMELRKEVGHRPLLQVGASVIVVDEHGRILLQLRSDNHCWGYAGGSVELDEVVEDAAKRELLEETGLVADKIEIKADKVASSAGCVSETSTIALAYVSDKTPQKSKLVDDGGVITDRVWVKKYDIKKWLFEKEKMGYVLTAQSLAALFYLD